MTKAGTEYQAMALTLGSSANDAAQAIRSVLQLPDVALSTYDAYAQLVANPVYANAGEILQRVLGSKLAGGHDQIAGGRIPVGADPEVGAKAAALVPVAISAVTGVGLPSYTSGTHRWNGNTLALKNTLTEKA